MTASRVIASPLHDPRSIFLVLLIAVVLTLCTADSTLAQGSWQTLAPMPTARDSVTSAAVGGVIYVFGGYDGVSHVNTTEAFDTNSGSWTTRAPMPLTRISDAAAATVGGKIYLFSGLVNSGSGLVPLGRVDVYDPQTDTWGAPRAPMPTLRSNVCVGVINGIIYVVGGQNASGEKNTVEAYDPSTDTWSTKASMPTARSYARAGAINNKLYVVGGANGNVELEEYDPATNSWNSRPSLPTPRFIPAAAALGGRLYVVGGAQSASMSLVEVYDPATNTWSAGGPMPTSRYNLSIATSGNSFYAIGGSQANPYGVRSANEVFSIPTTCGWMAKASLPVATAHGAGVSYDGKFYVMDPAIDFQPVVYDPLANSWSPIAANTLHRTMASGGVIGNKIYVAEGWSNSNSSTPTNALSVYDPATNTWASGPNSMIARGDAASAVIGTKLYLAGGSNYGNYTKYNDLEIYDSLTNSWSTAASMPMAIEYAAGAAINGKFYVVGGDYGPTNTNNTNSAFLFVYDPASNTWTAGPSMPTARSGPAAGVINGKLYVAGGWADSGVTNTVEIYDPVSNSWTAGPPELTARALGAAGVIDSKLYIAGGYSASAIIGNVNVLECAPATDSLPPVLSLPANIGAEAAGPGGSVVNFAVSAADNTDPNPVVSCTPPSGSIFHLGTTLVQCTATDASGNSANGSFSVTVQDTTAPALACGAADGVWHSDNVSINCTASDGGSGLADSIDSSFSLVTKVTSGSEDSNASTGSHQVCDAAGNCATAGPVAGNKIDRKGPVISVASPTNAGTYLLNQSVTINFSCTDGGSGVATCTGTTASGSALDTSTVGSRSFTVNATDTAGNPTTFTVNYSVGFALAALFDQARPVKSGGAAPIRIMLRDASGNNVSSPGIVVHAVSLVRVSTGISTTLEAPGNSNPDLDFRYSTDNGGTYQFNLKTTGLQTGTYRLFFQAGGSGALQYVDFQVKS